MSQEVATGRVDVEIQNLGGIESCEVSIDQGVTLLTGENATNRTSVLRALAGGLGGSTTTLKSDADEGGVELRFGSDRYTREYRRINGDVRTDGEPFTEDEALVDVFCCLLESNPARHAVERGDADGIREALMRPVDTEQINREVRESQEELRRIEDRLDEIEREKERLPVLEERRQALRDERADLQASIEAAEETVEDFEADLDRAEDAEAVVEELKEVRDTLEEVRQRLQTQQGAVEALEDDLESVQDELGDLPVPGEIDGELEQEIERVQRQERELDTTINNLVSIIEFNEQFIEGDSFGQQLVESTDADLLDDLDPSSQSLDCWTCGTTVERGQIDDRLDTLRELVEDKRAERRELSRHLEALREEAAAIRDRAARRESLEKRQRDIETELDERRGTIHNLQARETELRERVAHLEAEAAETEGLRDSDLLDEYRRRSELEYERGQVEEKLDTVQDEIDGIERMLAKEADLERQRVEVKEELEALRTRIEDLERSIIEEFNDHMESILDVLAYRNIERAWIERKTQTAGGGAVEEGSFHLHIVRTTDDGTVYEDAVHHLSESEREVIGLVVALAGYLAHDVHERVPFMLLDSLEAIDATRIDALIDYFADHTPYLVVALLPEDAASVADRYRRVAMGELPG